MCAVLFALAFASVIEIGFGKCVSPPDGLIAFKIPTANLTTRDDMIATATSVQNCYRKKHGAPPLTLDDSISGISQSWANNLAASDNFQHSQNDYGENLFAASPSIDNGGIPIYYWYKEYRDCSYDFLNQNQLAKQSCSTGHFTQVVWKSSQRVGFGIASSSGGMTYFVANYDPPGNYGGEYAANVGRPTDDIIGSCLPPGVKPESFDFESIQIL